MKLAHEAAAELDAVTAVLPVESSSLAAPIEDAIFRKLIDGGRA